MVWSGAVFVFVFLFLGLVLLCFLAFSSLFMGLLRLLGLILWIVRILNLFLSGNGLLFGILVAWFLFTFLHFLILLNFLSLGYSLCFCFSWEIFRRLRLFLLLGLSLNNLSIGLSTNLTKHFIIIIKDIAYQLTWGNQKLILPNKLNERPEHNSILLGNTLIFFNLLIEFDDVG